LVTEPPTLLQRTQFDLARFKHLWEQLGDQARVLLIDVAELDAAGGCPPELHSSIQHAISLCTNQAAEVVRKGGRGDGGGGDGNGDGVNHIHQETDNHIPTGGSRGVADFAEERLANILGGMKIGNPLSVVRRYGPKVVQEALDQLHARPSGTVVNRGAYLRGILSKYEPLSTQRNDPGKYTKGKYGHLVQR
jgi:hypothetical protein